LIDVNRNEYIMQNFSVERLSDYVKLFEAVMGFVSMLNARLNCLPSSSEIRLIWVR